ncbi:hypothetical protein GWI33_009340, partial [Rhynchophorus ferrugineus]
MDRKEFR